MFLSGGKNLNEIKLTMLEKINLILKIVIGSAISWKLAILFGSKYPYLGPISLILCIQATLIKSIRFGIARIVGTIIGVASVSLLASSLHANGWSIAMIMMVSLIIPLLFGVNATILHQIALSVVLVLEFEHKLHGYGLDRIRDSIIGVAVALLLHLFFNPPNYTKRAITEVEALPNKLADKLKSLATWLEAGAPQKNYFNSDFNLLRKKMLEVEKLIQKAELSLKFNPVSKKSKPLLHKGEFLLKTLNQVSADIDVLFKIMDEWSKTGSLTKESMEAWEQNFFLLESSLRNWNEGKAMIEVVLNQTRSNEKFYFPAIWHAQHLISTLKQYPRPII
jgi:uncharacterized membrane protein YgaE (UPF0421/DUF939 family)